MAVYGYVRVSSVDQVAGTSLEEQKRRIEGVALMLGEPLRRLFVDGGVSGGVPLEQRPQGGLLAAILLPGDTLIVAKLDRLFRNATDALVKTQEWAAQGVRLIVVDMGTEPVTENGLSKLMFTVLAAMAEWERERIAERTSEGRRAKRAKGGHIGGLPPFGYRKEGEGREARLVPDPAQQAALATIHEAAEAGMSCRRIAELVALQHNLAVSHESVRRIVKEGRRPEHERPVFLSRRP